MARVMGNSRSALVDQVYAHTMQSGMAGVVERVTARTNADAWAHVMGPASTGTSLLATKTPPLVPITTRWAIRQAQLYLSLVVTE